MKKTGGGKQFFIYESDKVFITKSDLRKRLTENGGNRQKIHGREHRKTDRALFFVKDGFDKEVIEYEAVIIDYLRDRTGDGCFLMLLG